jgi:lipoprotein-releasing system permease protein
MFEYDANLCYITLGDAQRLFGLPQGSVSGLGIKLSDWESSGIMEKYFQQQLKYPYWVRSWQRMNGNLFAALKLEKIMMFIILGLIILVASFNIISNLLLLSVEKAREIGIMSAIGIPRIRIGLVFFWEGVIIGGTGIILGFVAGLGTALALAKYQFIKLPADVYYMDHLPVRIIPSDVASVALAALLITIAAAVYPAWQATRMNPLDAIRYG